MERAGIAIPSVKFSDGLGLLRPATTAVPSERLETLSVRELGRTASSRAVEFPLAGPGRRIKAQPPAARMHNCTGRRTATV
jgi:hypothetical protein